MFQPFGSSSLAQNIIDSKLSGVSASTPMQPQDMNEFGVFRNPYSPAGFYANETDVSPKPAFTPPSSDEQGNPVCDNANGYYFDPVTQSCKLVESEQETTNESGGGNQTQPIYQGVGSISSPTQNAFMNLGLGSAFFDPENPDKKLDLYGDGLSGMFKRFSPLGQLGVYLDANTLANAGVINKRDDGGYSFAKGGNYFLADANKKFEDQLAKDNMMDFAQNTLGKTAEEAQAMADVTKRGDKADYMGSSVYRDNNANVNINPFQSNFGASNIVSYSPPKPDREKSESEKMFERKRAFVSPKKQINSQAFSGMGYTRGK
tara:strand:+ start:154 stop:1107 length:954 start_codon:yes stop_codon:yes gene_type:complete